MVRDALVVGINQYPFLKDTPTSKAKHLTTPASDAEAIAQLLEKYGDFQVRRLPGNNQDGKLRVDLKKPVKLKELQDAISELFQPKGHRIPETAVLFFAGHGFRRAWEGGTEGYLVTSDAGSSKVEYGLSLQWLRQFLNESPVRQQVIWLDCCNSGELLNFLATDLGEYEKGRDRCFIVASRNFQVAYEAAEGNHGVLSGALLQGLDPTLQAEKWVTNYSLVDFVKQALKDAPQHPICTNSGGQIILTGEQSVISSTCPYKGLAYFDFNEEDPKYFYGRTALTNQLLEKVRQSNFLAVLGASGSGKSSVVRAGLLYQLKLGEVILGSDRWKIYEPFSPSEHPLKMIEQVVGVSANQLKAIIKAAAAERVVLVVDQFEEVFTQCRDDAERQQFFKCLISVVEQLGNKLCLVLVMRDDFQHKCAQQDYTGLATKIDQNLLRTKQMSQEELREAITKPAEQVELEIDRELVNQIIADVSNSPGDLPLLQYTLTQLWEKYRFKRLTLSEYNHPDFGGVKKALENHANQVYKSLSIEEQKAAKGIFLGLTRLGEDEQTPNTRQQVRQQDLVNSQQSEVLVNQLVQRLATEKLVVTSEQELEGKRVAVVNIAHEALIRHWNLLGEWLKENQEALRTKQDIEDAAKEWRDNRKRGEEAYLLQGIRLAAAEDYLQRFADKVPLSNLAQEFVQRSRSHCRWRIGIRTGFVLAAIAAFSVALYQGKQVQIKNQTTFARQLVDRAVSIQNEQANLLPRGILLAVESLKRFHSLKLNSLEANQVLRQGLDLLPRSLPGVTYEEKQVYDFVFSPDSKHLAIANDNLLLMNIHDGKEVALIQQTKGFQTATFSQNRKYIAILKWDNAVQVWDLTSGRKLTQMTPDGDVKSMTFSPNARYLAINPNEKYSPTTEKKNIQVLDIHSNREVIAIKKKQISAASIAFSPDGRYLATGSDRSTSNKKTTLVQVWEINSGEEVARMLEQDNSVSASIEKITFSPNGKYLATAEWRTLATDRLSGVARIWEVSNGQEVSRMAHEHIVSSVAFSSDGKYIATASRDHTARVWEAISGKEVAQMKHDGRVWNVVFSPNGKYVATVSVGNTARVYETTSGKEVARMIHEGEVEIDTVSFSPNSKYLATKSVSYNDQRSNPDGTPKVESTTVKVWELISSTEVARMQPEEPVYQVFSTLDRKYLVTQSEQSIGGSVTLRVWDINNNREITQVKNIRQEPIALSSDGRYLAALIDNKTVGIWELSSGDQVNHISQHHSILAITFSVDGKYLLIVDKQNVKLLQLSNSYEVFVKKGINVLGTALSPNADFLATANRQNIKLLEISTGQEFVLMPDKNYVQLVFSPNGKYLAAVSDNGTGRIWDITTRKEVSFLKYKKGSLNSIAFSPNSRYLAIGGGQFMANGAKSSTNGTIQIWELPSGKEVSRMNSETGILNISFSPDEKFIATTDGEKIVRFWDINSRQEAARINSINSQAVTFSPNGKYLITAGGVYNPVTTGILQKWLWWSEDLIDEACTRLNRNLTQEEWHQYMGDEPYHKTCANLP